jgi:hypothetical protein
MADVFCNRLDVIVSNGLRIVYAIKKQNSFCQSIQYPFAFIKDEQRSISGTERRKNVSSGSNARDPK